MITPMGPLANLDLHDHNVCRDILARDKHKLIEGLVFEAHCEAYLLSLSNVSDESVRPVDVDTAVVRLPADSPYAAHGKMAAFVWARSRGPGLGRYLAALATRMPVWLVEHDEAGGDFTAAWVIEGGQPLREAQSLQDVTAHVASGASPRHVDVASDVRNDIILNQSFWGYLSERYGPDLGAKVVLPRIFLNWGIQPWFKHLWNVDRVFLHDDQLWHFEIKHKYPFVPNGSQGSRTLAFGINDGELRLMSTLVGCGLRSMHAVIVKPFWDRSAGSMYLRNNPDAPRRTAILGRELTAAALVAALGSRRGYSGLGTSFSGRTQVGYRTFPVGTFHELGLLSDDPAEVARRILSQMTRRDQPLCSDDALRQLRMSKK